MDTDLRYFRIDNPTDRKNAMIIYVGKEIARLEKSLPDLDGDSNEYEKLRKKLNDYFAPKQNRILINCENFLLTNIAQLTLQHLQK